MKDGEDYLFIPLNRRKEASNKLVIIINLLVVMCEFGDFRGGGGMAASLLFVITLLYK